MASFDLPEISQPRVSSALLVGVASPLWSYFGAAAVGGVAYWWMTQWARPVNLEALMGAPKPVTLALPEPDVEMAAADAAQAIPLVEPEPILDAIPELEPVLEVAAEPVIEEPAPIGAALAEELPPKLRAKKAPPFEPEA